jgi:hypothetical protein
MSKRLAMLVLIAAGGALCVGSFMAWEWFGPPPQLGLPTATYGMHADGPITLLVGIFAVLAGTYFLRRGSSVRLTVTCICVLGVGLLVAIRYLSDYVRIGFNPHGVHSLGNGLVICLLASAIGTVASIFLLITAAKTREAPPELPLASA